MQRMRMFSTINASIRFFVTVLFIASFLIAGSGTSFAFKLPDTGQTKCYQGVSPYAEIPCAGTGQDGEYNINPLSYTGDSNGTVTDNNTGLTWQKEDDNNTYNWFEASGTYDVTYNPTSIDVCGSLTLGGLSDWRLPTKKELISIVDYSIAFTGATINPVFTNTNTSIYWSSVTDANDPGVAWGVSFLYGTGTGYGKDTGNYYVRCVRGGQLDFGKFQDNGNGSITDNSTELMWQKNESITMKWQAALDYCNGLNLAGETDWRLPNIKELESLTDDTGYNPAIDTAYFPGAMAYSYWSSTTYAYYPNYAWFVGFNAGNVNYLSKNNGDYVRCVRGGQLISPSGLTAKPTSPTSIVLGWRDHATIETGFKVERKSGDCASANSWAQIATKAANAITHTNTGLTPNTTYAYRVRAYNAGGNSLYTGCASAKTGLAGTPKSPTNLKAISASTTKVNLTWTDSFLDETSFEIYRKVNSGIFSLLHTTAANAVSYSDTTATGNDSTASYSYYLNACNAAGCSPVTGTAAVPLKPTSLTTSAVSSTQINLSWTDNSSNESGFQVYRKPGNCLAPGTWTLLETTGVNVEAIDNTGLISGTTYSYKVRAFNKSTAAPYANGYSMYSGCSSKTTP